MPVWLSVWVLAVKASLDLGPCKYLVTYNPVYRTGISKNSLEKLQVQHPDIYDEYVEVTESRRFSAKKVEAA